MKRLFVFATAVVLLLSPIAAQSISIGPKAAIGYSGMRGDYWQTLLDSMGYSNMFSLTYSAGATIVAQLSPLLGVQADILYSKYSYKVGNSSYWGKVDWNALSFPVYARLSYDFGPVTAYALAGVDMNYLIGDTSGDTSNGTTVTPTAVAEAFESVFVWGIGAGAGVTLPVGPGSLDIGLRYRTDFNGRFLFLESAKDIFNQSITADIAYRFKIL